MAGWILNGIGFVAAAPTPPSSETIWRLGAAAFIAAPLFSLAALLSIKRYPFSQEIINRLTLIQPLSKNVGTAQFDAEMTAPEAMAR